MTECITLTKLFDNREGGIPIDVRINDFINAQITRELVDIKMIAVAETFQTQCEYIAVIIYRQYTVGGDLYQ